MQTVLGPQGEEYLLDRMFYNAKEGPTLLSLTLMPLPGVLALVNVHTAPLSVRPCALQALVTVLVPVTAKGLVTTPGKSVNTFVMSRISKQYSSYCL